MSSSSITLPNGHPFWLKMVIPGRESVGVLVSEVHLVNTRQFAQNEIRDSCSLSRPQSQHAPCFLFFVPSLYVILCTCPRLLMCAVYTSCQPGIPGNLRAGICSCAATPPRISYPYYSVTCAKVRTLRDLRNNCHALTYPLQP